MTKKLITFKELSETQKTLRVKEAMIFLTHLDRLNHGKDFPETCYKDAYNYSMTQDDWLYDSETGEYTEEEIK